MRQWTVADLLQRVAELETALTPFAVAASAFRARPDAARVFSSFAADITVGDLRRAAQRLRVESSTDGG